MEYLNVFVRNTLVGKILWDMNALSFVYDENYVSAGSAVPVSVSLPLDGNFDNNSVEAFFSGLLPDELLRKKLAEYFQVSFDNTFALLKEMGAECAGAISVLSPDKSPNEPLKPEYKELSEEQSYILLSDITKNPLGVDFNGYFRISGSGAQDKLIARVENGRILLPINGTPSTHIIKPEIQNYPTSQFNEFFCMTLAKDVGLNVSNVDLLILRDKTFFVTERYDRIRNKAGNLVRLHQEDFCQALKVNPKIKYENEGGPNIENCFNCIKVHSSLAGRDTLCFLETVMFNFIIGNGDAHAKNFSLLYEDDKITLAPLYDLMSSQALRDFNRKEKLAMKIDGEYLFDHIFMRKFENLAVSLGLKKDTFEQIYHKKFSNITEKAAILRDKFNNTSGYASAVYDKILQVIENNSKQLL